jgi:hypothetical protein
MIRRLIRWLAPLAVMALWTAVALAAAGATGDDEGGPPQRVPVLGYFLAFAFTVLTLVIVCMPSRKS